LSAAPDGYEISTDPGRLDTDLIHRWLSTDAYWALGRTRETQDRALGGSTTYGVYRTADGRQVAVARVVTDGATFAYLADVYVDRAVRGTGIGTWLVSSVVADLRHDGVQRVTLRTADAHALYAKLGFTDSDPGRWMELDVP
jgi:GNAT superfamily N-acetyltransferase